MGISSSKPATKYLPAFEANLPSLKGKTVAITGCTSGTGLVAAKVTARKGADAIIMLNRPSIRATKAEEEVRAEIPHGAKTRVETISCDLQNLQSVQEAADDIKRKYKAIDVLCNNAGIMAMEDRRTTDGYDCQMQTNHISHFKLTQQLYPLLKKAKDLRGEARIVNHSSVARRGELLEEKYFGKNGGNLGGNGTANWTRYHQSKLANVVFTLALNDKLSGSGILTACCAPGYAVTNLADASQGMSGFMWTRTLIAQSAEDGTMPLLECCFGTSTKSGDFFEPSKWFNMVGPAVKVKLAKECTDKASRKLLWEASEKACGKFEL